MSPTDYTLLKKIKSGDRPAFMLLYDRYWDSLYSFVFVRTRDKEITEEILQNLWVKLLEHTDTMLFLKSLRLEIFLIPFIHQNSKSRENLIPLFILLLQKILGFLLSTVLRLRTAIQD